MTNKIYERKTGVKHLFLILFKYLHLSG